MRLGRANDKCRTEPSRVTGACDRVFEFSHHDADQRMSPRLEQRGGCHLNTCAYVTLNVTARNAPINHIRLRERMPKCCIQATDAFSVKPETASLVPVTATPASERTKATSRHTFFCARARLVQR